MKHFLRLIPGMLLVVPLLAVEVPVYTNYLRQFQSPSGVVWDAFDTVTPTGSKPSALEINPGGARFDLWTVKSSPYTEYLLDTKYVSTYTPTATVVITSEDPYVTIPRTRADRPFYVKITVSGLSIDPLYPPASKSVTFYRHVQSYAADGIGVGIDRTQATQYSQAAIATAAPQALTYTVTSIPGTDRTKVRGEERFSVFTLPDSTTTPATPASQIDSQYIQIWPMANGSITGLTEGQVIRFAMPQVTFTLNDTYPGSRNYAQVYKGSPRLGVTGTQMPGQKLNTEDRPCDYVLTPINYDGIFDADGVWTMELVTENTIFGSSERLAYVSFTVDRTIEMNGTFTTIE